MALKTEKHLKIWFSPSNFIWYLKTFLSSDCKLNPCDIDSMLGFMPGEVIGWIEKDGINGASSDEETAYASDEIGEGVTVFVYCNNW